MIARRSSEDAYMTSSLIELPGHEASRRATTLPRCVLALLIVTMAPLFICMPLTADVAMYDLQAHNLMNGGVLYRDIFEPNLPGAVWVHVVVRSLLGESSEAIRIADLFLFGTAVMLLVRWIRSNGAGRIVQSWAAVFCVLFYFSISEWNHCQRDTWLLLPALAALHLRRLQVERLGGDAASGGRTLAWAALEGLCWGAGVWLKPMIVVPAVASWIVSCLIVRRARPILMDFAGLMIGGLLVGGAGVLWLYQSGAWPYFWDTFFEWNPVYFATRRANWKPREAMHLGLRFFPWSLLHLVAVPVALHALIRSFRIAKDAPAPAGPAIRIAKPLFAVFYLSWLVQATFLQHLFDYVHAPGMLLALAVMASAPPLWRNAQVERVAVAQFLLIALLFSPLLHPRRLICWPACITQGSTPEIKTRLAQSVIRDWQDIERVAKFLESKNLQDGELTCYNTNLVHLYRRLNVRPSTKYIYLRLLMEYFPPYREMIRQTVLESPQRFIVSDLNVTRLPFDRRVAALADRQPTELPWSYPVVYRAGRFVVHEVTKRKGLRDTAVAGDKVSRAPSDG